MKLFKKLDIFVFKSYALLFVGTFFICLFIFMMQFMWLHIDKLIGKGLSLDVLAKFFYYASLTLIPMSLPLAILLASLITFGNFGERFELLSMKAAGISLIRVFRPIIIFTLCLSAWSFYFQNVTSPNATKELAALIYSMKQKSPELEIPEGIFYNEIPGYNLFVEQKDKQTGLLYNVMIYSKGTTNNDMQIVLCDSARLQTSADKKYLQLTMYHGERFQNMKEKTAQAIANVPYMRETFIQEIDLIPFDANFNALDASLLSGNAQTKDIKAIKTDIDSLELQKDSVAKASYQSVSRTFLRRSLSLSAQDSAKAEKTLQAPINFDTLYNSFSAMQKQGIIAKAASKVRSASSEYEFRKYTTNDLNHSLRLHWVEFNKKFTLSVACLIFFFIGAPLGAIIRKGGLGVPVIVSVAIFIFYYIVNVSGEKLAKTGDMNVMLGVWLSSIVLFPIGAFLTYKANKDSVVFNIEAYQTFFKKLFGIRISRHINRKEVIIYDPDYPTIQKEIQVLCTACKDYTSRHRLMRAPNYIQLYFKYKDDTEVISLNEDLERIITILSNSKDAAILEALNKLPVISVHAHTRPFHSHRLNRTLGIIFPLGLFFYLRIWRYRLRLYRDMQLIQKYGTFINTRIDKILSENKTI